ncbi:Nse4 C-terminal-domain-containing protein [Tricharina praecox]|uniref:Nse4 C-terminal-domain-containing protein n=1 Tax=Tricharina praecox TaxID=43433 RepID=UPI00221EE681|nr:Nse4 C-terminal-domain-containing protein [Tricharina praecox]KAI5844798.1 Nse4 C-terminal-domain-containing protein [Tricharina praecox]
MPRQSHSTRTRRVDALDSDDEEQDSPSTRHRDAAPASTARRRQPRAQTNDDEDDEVKSEAESGGEEEAGDARDKNDTSTLKNKDKDAVYDPEQNLNERRHVRQGYRVLQKSLEESKAEYLQRDNENLYEAFASANRLYKNVKQTSDATLDSRLLVTASDLALKRVTTMVVGSSSTGIDVDEFVGKCFSFMKRAGREAAPRREEEEGDDDNEDHGDASDWAYLGRAAAYKGNKRPPTIEFLLGPLSLQKRVRVVRTRKEGIEHQPGTQATRPIDMSAEDIQQSQTTTLKLVKKVHGLLIKYMESDQYDGETDPGLRLFDVVINPESYGQTIENIFVISFLVGEGRVAIWTDEDTGIPMLSAATEATPAQRESGEVSRKQSIFSLTMYEWKRIIEVYSITKSVIIPTRPKEEINITATGWYA